MPAVRLLAGGGASRGGRTDAPETAPLMPVRTIQPDRSIREYVRSLWIVNRYEALLAYNVGYFCIVVAVAVSVGLDASRLPLLGVLFGAVIAMKSQASIADALHDYEADRANPEKSYVSRSVDVLGEENARTLLVSQLLVSMLLWGYLTHRTGEPFYLVAGAVACLFGYTYSYPPRFKERGFLNHLVTSGVDAACVLLPGLVLLTAAPPATFLPVLVVAFWYSLAFHVMHQAGDTYQDRRASMSTFTGSVGVGAAVLASVAFLSIAAGVAAYARYPLIAAVCVGYGAYFLLVYARTRGEPSQRRSRAVSEAFSVARCASILNAAFALDFLVRTLL